MALTVMIFVTGHRTIVKVHQQSLKAFVTTAQFLVVYVAETMKVSHSVLIMERTKDAAGSIQTLIKLMIVGLSTAIEIFLE